MIWRKKNNGSSQQVVAREESAGHLVGGAAAPTQPSTQPGAHRQGMLEAKNADRLSGGEESKVPQFRLNLGSATAPRSYAVPRRYKISGNLFSARPITVFGELVGRELSAGVVTVMPGGVLRGDARVGTLLAAGLFDGHLQAGRGVEVSSQGELRGEIVSPSIDVQAGARISGASLRIGGAQLSREDFRKSK